MSRRGRRGGDRSGDTPTVGRRRGSRSVGFHFSIAGTGTDDVMPQ